METPNTPESNGKASQSAPVAGPAKSLGARVLTVAASARSRILQALGVPRPIPAPASISPASAHVTSSAIPLASMPVQTTATAPAPSSVLISSVFDVSLAPYSFFDPTTDAKDVYMATLKARRGGKSLIVGRNGRVETPAGVLLGADDEISFDVRDYADKATFRLAVQEFFERVDKDTALEKKSAGTLIARRIPAQCHALSEEKWRLLMVATAQYRDVTSVRVSPLTIETLNSLWALDRAGNAGTPAAVIVDDEDEELFAEAFIDDEGHAGALHLLFDAQDPLPSDATLRSFPRIPISPSATIPGTRVAITGALRHLWEGLNEKARTDAREIFELEAGIDDLQFRLDFGLGTETLVEIRELLHSLEVTPSDKNQQSAWRAGFNMDLVHDAIRGFYDGIDREALSMTASLFENPDLQSYRRILKHKAGAMAAIRDHAGLAALHMPPELLDPTSDHAAARDNAASRNIQLFQRTALAGLGQPALQALNRPSPRYLMISVSRAVSAMSRSGQNESAAQAVENARRLAEFFNATLSSGRLPAYSLLKHTRFYEWMFETVGTSPAVAHASAVNDAVRRSTVTEGLVKKGWSVHDATRALILDESAQEIFDGFRSASGNIYIPTAQGTVEYLDRVRPRGFTSTDASCWGEDADYRPVGPRASAMRCARLIQSRLRPIPAATLGIEGYDSTNSEWIPKVSLGVGSVPFRHEVQRPPRGTYCGLYNVTYELSPRIPGRRIANIEVELLQVGRMGVESGRFEMTQRRQDTAGILPNVRGMSRGIFADVERGSPAEAKKLLANKEKKISSRNKDGEPMLLPDQVNAIRSTISKQLAAFKSKEPLLYHSVLDTDPVVMAQDFEKSKIRSSRVLEQSLRLALGSRGAWDPIPVCVPTVEGLTSAHEAVADHPEDVVDTAITTPGVAPESSRPAPVRTKSVIDLLVARLPDAYRRDANGRSLVDVALDVGSPLGVRELLRASREVAAASDGPAAPKNFAVSAIETALRRHNPEFVAVLLTTEPELTQAHLDAYEALHPKLISQEIHAGFGAGMMRVAIREARESAACAPAPKVAEVAEVAEVKVNRRRMAPL